MAENSPSDKAHWEVYEIILFRDLGVRRCVVGFALPVAKVSEASSRAQPVCCDNLPSYLMWFKTNL